MMQALAAIGGGGTLLFGIAFITLAFLNRRDARDLLNARDLLDSKDEELTKVRGELLLESATLVTTQDELRKEKNLRASAEAERNDAYRTARDQIVERLKKGNVADANHLITDLLSMPLGGMPKAVPEGRATAPGPDALIDPWPVQPPKSP
jgi:hypothetical protein